jgi:hypothetical protein
MTDEQRVTVSCPGCGRTQTVRRSKLIRCDYYTCGLGCCKQNPDFRLPARPNDLYVIEHVLCAAGGFSGVKFRLMSPEDYASVKRARAIMEAARRKLSEE